MSSPSSCLPTASSGRLWVLEGYDGALQRCLDLSSRAGALRDGGDLFADAYSGVGDVDEFRVDRESVGNNGGLGSAEVDQRLGRKEGLAMEQMKYAVGRRFCLHRKSFAMKLVVQLCAVDMFLFCGGGLTNLSLFYVLVLWKF